MKEWKSIVWRLLRGSVATAFAQTVILSVDWSNPEMAMRTLVASFVSGLLLALSKSIRASTNNSMVNKLPIL